jgi:hypothetical protein
MYYDEDKADPMERDETTDDMSRAALLAVSKESDMAF